MTTELKKTDVLGKIYTNFTLKEKDKTLLDKCFVDDINIPRLNTVIDVMIQYMMQTEVLVAYVLFQSYKTNPEEAKALATLPSKEEIYAKMLGCINSPASGIANSINAVMASLTRAMAAVRDSKSN